MTSFSDTPLEETPARRLRVIAGSPSDADHIAALLDDAPITLVLPVGDVPWRLQILAIALADLLGRLFPRIQFEGNTHGPSHRDLPPGPVTLFERLQSVARHGGLPDLGPGEEPAAVSIYVGGHALPDLPESI